MIDLKYVDRQTQFSINGIYTMLWTFIQSIQKNLSNNDLNNKSNLFLKKASYLKRFNQKLMLLVKQIEQKKCRFKCL